LNGAYRALYARSTKDVLERIPVVRRIYAGWLKPHPFDVSHGTDTSGFVPTEAITSDEQLGKRIIVYAGSQPSIVRTAISKLPQHAEYSFVDLGCGKGRATIVASEFPFRSVQGVELSSDLARIARENIESVRKQFPARPSVKIVEGNALKLPFPAGRVVIFMYHPFGPELMAELVKALEEQLAGEIEHLFVIYKNPVHGHLFDESWAFTRWYAEVLPYADSEVGFGPDLEETVVIWQSVKNAMPCAHGGAERPIRIVKPLWTASLGDKRDKGTRGQGHKGMK